MGTWLAFDPDNRQFVGSTGIKHGSNLSQEAALAGIVSNHGIERPALFFIEDDAEAMQADKKLRLNEFEAVWEGDEVSGVQPIPQPPALYLVCSITDTDGQDPPGLVNDGVDSFIFNARLEAEDGTLVPANDFWRIAVRDEAGNLYDQVGITMTDGIAAATYTTTGPPAKGIHLDENDLNEVPVVVPGLGDCRVVIRENINFKVYRNLS